jgi:hypothetical protein
MTQTEILNECKQQIAIKEGFKSWSEFDEFTTYGNDFEIAMHEVSILFAQRMAEKFAEWIADNYTLVRAAMMPDKWVNYKEHNVYTHGSDYHYSSLVSQFGKDTSVIYTEFLTTLNKEK